MKIIQALENSNILPKRVLKQLKMKQKRGFLSVLLGTLGASLLGNLITGKGILRAGTGKKKGKGILRAGTGRPSSSALQKQWDF